MYRLLRSRPNKGVATSRFISEMNVESINDILNTIDDDINRISKSIKSCDMSSIPIKAVKISTQIEHAKAISDRHTSSLSSREIERINDAIRETEVRFLRTINKLNIERKCLHYANK